MAAKKQTNTKRSGGRPTKLNDEVAKTILEHVAIGSYREVAAEAAGITRRTFQNWIARGQEHDQDDDTKIAPEHLPFVEFFRALKKAEARAEVDLLTRVRRDSHGWQRYMTILERKHPERWGRRDTTKVEHSGKIEHGPDLSKLSVEELRALDEILAKAEQ